RHHRRNLRARKRATEIGHRPLTIDDRRDTELLIHIPGRAEAGQFLRQPNSTWRSRPISQPKSLARVEEHSGEHPGTAATCSPVPKPFQVHKSCHPFFTLAAIQLISTSEFPGNAATATVVRAG